MSENVKTSFADLDPSLSDPSQDNRESYNAESTFVDRKFTAQRPYPTASTVEDLLPKGLNENYIDPLVEKGKEWSDDPATKGAKEAIKEKLLINMKLFQGILDNFPVFLAICTGLFGMSVVAVFFHFIRNVVNLDTSDLLQSVSYAVFFICVIVGILRNGYDKRKITRLQNKHLEAEETFKRQLEQLKYFYEKLLDEKMTEKEKVESGYKHMLQKQEIWIEDHKAYIKRLKADGRKTKLNFNPSFIFKRNKN